RNPPPHPPRTGRTADHGRPRTPNVTSHPAGGVRSAHMGCEEWYAGEPGGPGGMGDRAARRWSPIETATAAAPRHTAGMLTMRVIRLVVHSQTRQPVLVLG